MLSCVVFVLYLSCLWVSKQSKLLRYWRTSRLLLLLSWHLSSHCWAANCLLYHWTCSLACHCFLSSQFSIAKAPESMRKAVYFNCKAVTNRQAKPQAKSQLAPTAPARLWPSCYGNLLFFFLACTPPFLGIFGNLFNQYLKLKLLKYKLYGILTPLSTFVIYVCSTNSLASRWVQVSKMLCTKK